MRRKHSRAFSEWNPVSAKSCFLGIYLPLLPLLDFDKANEVYFRLGIIYKTQQKFKASLEVSAASAPRDHRSSPAVFPIYLEQSAETVDRGRHLVPGRTRARAAERRELPSSLFLSFTERAL